MRTWLKRIWLVTIVLLSVLAVLALYHAIRSKAPVGFQTVQAKTADGRPFDITLWYPTDQAAGWPQMLGPVLLMAKRNAPPTGTQWPLVVISHGNGGGSVSHADLAMALAGAGYLVAAPMHSGDNYADQSAAGSVTLFADRSQQLHATVEYLLTLWPERARINPQRIGAFGFSAGGLTVLAAAGAKPDLGQIEPHCKQSPEFICDVLRQAKSPLLNASAAMAGHGFVAEPRLRAAVVAAPGLGFTLGKQELANVRIPIQLWRGEQDDKVPYASNGARLREALGTAVEFHSVPGAGHFSFLTPCGLLKPPGVCDDPGEFDRAAFHDAMNAKVLAFFAQHLASP